MLASGEYADGADMLEDADVVSPIYLASRLEEEGVCSREEDSQVDRGVGSFENKSTELLVKKGT